MSYNVVEKRRMAAFNLDSYNRTCVHTSDLPNGSVVVLNTQNEDGSWNCSKPTNTTKGVWMITSPEVNRENKVKGGTLDPRDFTNEAGIPMDATYLNVKDIVSMTGEGIANIATRAYLVLGTDNTFVASDMPTTDGSTCLKKVRTDILRIGSTELIPYNPPMYVFEVVSN